MDEKVLSVLNKYQLIQQGDKLLIGVSGGPDSMALLHWLWQHQSRWQLQLAVAHLNHQLRGLSADKDEQFVQEMCAKWEIPCYTAQQAVAQYAKVHGLNKQAAARECRYTFFEQTAKRLGSTKLAVAHHADDQAETILMRFIRGTSLHGLAGIPVKRIASPYVIIRPFITLAKREIEDYCAQHLIPYRIDESNETDAYTRNKIRHQLIPVCKEINPNLIDTIGELAASLREEDDWLQQQAEQACERVIIEKKAHKISVSPSALLEVPLPLQKRVILIILNYLTHQADWHRIHIEEILKLVYQESGYKQLTLPAGVRVEKVYQTLVFKCTEVKEETKEAKEAKEAKEVREVREVIEKRAIREFKGARDAAVSSYRVNLPAEGEFILNQPALRIEVSLHDVTEADHNDKFQLQKEKQDHAPRKKEMLAFFDASKLTLPLTIRCWQPGDRIQPLGMTGTKKVNRIFIDSKVPAFERELWPIVQDAQDIIWIPGLVRSAKAELTKQSSRMITISVKNLEED